MNQELLSELIAQCTTESTEYFDGRGNCTTSLFDKEKFASLIVDLCIDLVAVTPNGYKDYRNQIEDSFRQDVISSIKYNFGV